MKYESPTSCGIQVTAIIEVFVHATNADARAMTLAPQTYLSQLAKNDSVGRSTIKLRVFH